ncbi:MULTISPECIES: DUF881 domain-containing protein [unclassified Mumia]|uniref:DUF881 domain-containing protein n=1 Tax=unclassified Mumia TaxID=2621872 RepID=UPI00260B757C|nr:MULTISPECIES: DUF881 domain-containing protein [unclassified Mumia]MDD9350425.1 DUF881 domain-containing protein [Mumia sp.]
MTVQDDDAQTPRRRRDPWRIAVPVTTALAGALFVTSAISSEGGDLRKEGTDLPALVEQRRESVAAQQQVVDDLSTQIETLAEDVENREVTTARQEVKALRGPAGFTEVSGPGLRVSLEDAPREVDEPGLDPNLLVVHQQDIQAFVNALWEGGASAVTLQGQRLISTTGIKCVGNTVILNGVPYSPPYVIEAVGDVGDLYSGLDLSGAVEVYRDYADRYQLGLSITTKAEIVAPAYAGTVDLQHATPVG